jgi:hypothetical protein
MALLASRAPRGVGAHNGSMLRLPTCRGTMFHHGQADEGQPWPSRVARRALRIVSDPGKPGLLCDLYGARDHWHCQSLVRLGSVVAKKRRSAAVDSSVAQADAEPDRRWTYRLRSPKRTKGARGTVIVAVVLNTPAANTS